MFDTQKEEELFEMEPQGSDMDAHICSGKSMLVSALKIAVTVADTKDFVLAIAAMNEKMAQHLRGGNVSPRAMHYMAANFDICSAHLARTLDKLKDAEDALAAALASKTA